MGTHESTIVVRMPDDLKSRLKMEAKKLGVSVSKLIRMKLLALEESGGEKKAVVKLGSRKYDLDEILRPDLISYEPIVAPSQRRGLAFTLGIKNREKGDKGVFTDEGARLIALSRKVAIDFVNDMITPEHFLYGITRMPDSNGLRILEAFSVDAEGVQREIEDLMKRSGKMVQIGDMPLNSQAEKVMLTARKEIGALGVEYVGTEHILLAILRIADSVAATLLVGEGVTYDEVLRVVRDS